MTPTNKGNLMFSKTVTANKLTVGTEIRVDNVDHVITYITTVNAMIFIDTATRITQFSTVDFRVTPSTKFKIVRK